MKHHLIEIHSMKGWTATTSYWGKKKNKYKKHTEKFIKKSLQKKESFDLNKDLITFDLKLFRSYIKEKYFPRKEFQKSSCAKQEFVNIDIHKTATNGDREIMQSVT